MGKYINQNSKGEALGLQKLNGLIQDGATKISPPIEWQEGLVCVLENGMFDAACYCYDKQEMQACLEPDSRRKTWLKYDQAKDVAV